MSKIKNGGLDQYGAGPSNSNSLGQLALKGLMWTYSTVTDYIHISCLALFINTTVNHRLYMLHKTHKNMSNYCISCVQKNTASVSVKTDNSRNASAS